MSEMVLLFWVVAVISMITALAMAFVSLMDVTAPPDITDLFELYRPLNPERFLELLDSLMDDANHPVLSRAEFYVMQRKRMVHIREYLERLSHNATLTYHIAFHAKMLEESEPRAERNLDDLQRYRELVEASLKLGFYARAGLAKVRFWMLARTNPWCPLPPPRLATLKQTKEFDFVVGYSRYKKAVCDYGLIYGREFHEVLMGLL